MSIIKYLDRIKKMDDLIRRKATGTPDEFAERLDLSRSALMKYLKLLKEIKAPLEYDQYRRTYYYVFPCKLKIGCESKLLDDKELVHVNKKSLRKICKIVSV
ncbi:MAG: helix-turn-helix domain-containing protein [Cytophagales bacterium]|nr:helix-turn-helix domain-containing protein [Cytophagales bacterium]